MTSWALALASPWGLVLEENSYLRECHLRRFGEILLVRLIIGLYLWSQQGDPSVNKLAPERLHDHAFTDGLAKLLEIGSLFAAGPGSRTCRFGMPFLSIRVLDVAVHILVGLNTDAQFFSLLQHQLRLNHLAGEEFLLACSNAS